MNFWPFNKSDNKEEKTADAKNDEIPFAEPESHFHSMYRQYEEFKKNNLPIGFERKINQTKPYILASFLAWPLYWMYRGLEWRNYRQRVQLPIYIHKTYMTAKFMQLSILLLGLSLASMMDKKNKAAAQNISNQTKG